MTGAPAIVDAGSVPLPGGASALGSLAVRSRRCCRPQLGAVEIGSLAAAWAWRNVGASRGVLCCQMVVPLHNGIARRYLSF